MAVCGTCGGFAQTGAGRVAVGRAAHGNHEHPHVSAGSAGSRLCRKPRFPNHLSQLGRVSRSAASACRGASPTEPRRDRCSRPGRGRRSQECDANHTHRLGDPRRCSSSWLDRERSSTHRQRHGVRAIRAGLPAKQMEFAREVVPGASKIGLLTNLSDPKAPPQAQELLAAGRSLEVEVTSSDANRPDEIDSALEVLANRHLDVVIVLQTSMLLGNSRQIAASALAKRLPTIYGYRAHVVAGGLASYGVDLEWCWRRSASFVDKILHGARPRDLPVEFPTKMLMSVNLKTAKALGITLPSSLLVRADEVIE